eukprot:5524227-Amphidinium_carterae.1
MEVVTFIDDATNNVVRMCTSWRLRQQHLKPQTRDQSTQTPNTPDREVRTSTCTNTAEGSTKDGIAGQLQEPSRSRANTRSAKFAVRRRSALL